MAKKIYILDGHSHLYSAYYAIRRLSSPAGEPTNAAYGMTSVILKLIREQAPDYLIAVFDPPGKNWRHAIYPDYKANRPPMPDDLLVQVSRIRDVLEKMGVSIMMIDGYEADDVIATLVQKSVDAELDVVVCSKDKDLEQLISDKVRCYDSTKEKFTDRESLLQEKGISPEQVCDMLALMGDKIDNVPGIPSVGDKTAVRLIEEFGTIDSLLQQIEKLPPKVKDYLSKPEHIEKLRLSQKLVSLDKNVPLEFSPEAWTVEIPNKEELARLFTELGFTRFLQQYGLAAKVQTPAPVSPPAAKKQTEFTGGLFDFMTEEADAPAPVKTDSNRFRQIKSLVELESLVKEWEIKPFLAVDTETTGIDPIACDLVGLSFACDSETGWYLPLRTCDNQHLDLRKSLEIVKPLLETSSVKKIGQNIKYDFLVLRNAGIELGGIYFDTMIASYILDPSRTSHGMDHLAKEMLNYDTIKISELIGTGKNQLTLDKVATSRVADYSAEDAWVTYRLFEHTRPKIEEANLETLFFDVEMPLVSVLSDMEWNGVTVDSERLKGLSKTLETKMNRLVDEIFSLAGQPFNIDSPKQLAGILFDRLKLPVGKTTKTGRSTDVGVLEDLSSRHPLPKLILEYRQMAKLKNTYIDRLPEMINPRTKKIHASFNQTVTATGRLSSSDPNLQNIPVRSEVGKLIRSAFVPADRENRSILTCDYSQIELRLLAHLSRDAHLIEAFKQDRDIHTFVASQVFNVELHQVSEEQRRVAKTVNFGIVYGQTAHGLSQTLGISRTDAQTFINDYFARYPRVKEFIAECIEETRRTHYAQTMLRRRRPIPEINSTIPAQRAFAERTAVNTVVQGSAADMIKLAMISIQKEIREKKIPAAMLIQVHDELVFEVLSASAESAKNRIVELMADAIPLNVPVKVDAEIGPNWLETK